MDEKVTFSFGKNWQSYLKGLTPERVEIAKKSLQDFYALDTLRGKSFLDIGCGSGLFSYAAHLLGASPILSFDIDPFSVACCRHLAEKANNPTDWKITKKSILDHDVLSLGQFDVVYAWGALHHTGDMWRAMRNAASLTARGGYFYVAIYNKIPGRLGSRLWRTIKKFYNRLPFFLKFIMEWLYIMYFFFFKNLIRGKNPFQKMKNYSAKRGMDWRRDVSDWLGGYPYEFATVDEVFNYIKENFSDFNLIKLKSVQDHGNNWFVFKRDN